MANLQCRTPKEVKAIVRSITDYELTQRAYQTDAKTNIRDLPLPTAINANQRVTKSKSKRLAQDIETSSTQYTDDSRYQELIKSNNSDTEQPLEDVVKRIIEHGINEDPDHSSAQVGETI